MITEYHRPGTLDEAVELVSRPGAAVLVEASAAASTAPTGPTVAIDLQALALDEIRMDGDTLTIGAMATLSDVSTSGLAPKLIAELAKREFPSTIRNVATVGGVIATNDPESEFLAGLVAFNASIRLERPSGPQEHTVEAILGDPGKIDNAVMVDISMEPSGAAAAHRTGRTPKDRPIVLVVGRKDPDGSIRLGITGVDTRVIEMSPGHTAELDPPSDFRGTAAYRRSLATVLTERVLTDLSGGGA